MATYTQGLMDLGATVCTIRRPACDACPANASCAARAAGAPEKFPRQDAQAQAQPRRLGVLLWLQQAGRVWLVRRADSACGAQLWSLPEFDTAVALEHAVQHWPGTLEWMAPFKHVLTHFDWMLQPLRFQWHGAVSAGQQREIDALAAVNRSTLTDEADTADATGPHTDAAPQEIGVAPAATEGRWFARADLDGVGMPAPIRKLLDAAL